VTEDEVIGLFTRLPDVVAVTASDGDGSPEVAWGDTFVHYEPDGVGDRMFPFATIVVKDYPGFDTHSQLDRPGVYRVNVAVGRAGFERLLGFPPAGFTEHSDDFDYAELDRLLPHPVYGKQGWVSVVVPGDRTADLLSDLIDTAYQREQTRRRRGHTSRDDE
jgi:Family of unknown function (DUF6194)